jgi:serine/threonine-protein kinase
MAAVYHAVDVRLERTVAVKVLHPDHAADPGSAERFVREARTIAQLSHPNVVAVFDQGTWPSEDGQAFMVMEYIHGQTLRELLNDHGKLSPAEALMVLEPMLQALAAAHRIGMVHRDIKPENVLIGDDGSVKVADFGLARVADSSGSTTTRGVLMGTVAYVPPELVANGRADPRSDVYSAGIVLYEMLTGEVPFRGDTALSVAWQHVNVDVPAPSRVQSSIPVPLDELTQHATRREPGARPMDAGALLAELHDARADLALPLVPLPPRTLALTGYPTTTVPQSRVLDPQPSFPPRLALEAEAPARGSASVTRPPDLQEETELEDEFTPPRPHRRRSRRSLVWLAVVLALAILLAGGGWYLGVGQYTTSPPVLGKTRAQAASILQEAGLTTLYASAAFSETTPSGLVMNQDPDPRARIRRGGTVTLTVSRGPERYLVPGIAGLSRDAAEDSLTSTHLRPQVRESYNDTVASGIVVSVSPEPGSSVRRDTVILLVVSKGPPPVQLPNLQGKTSAEAQSTLKKLGLNATLTEEFDEKVEAGRVVSQRPGASTVLKGSGVALVVSKGPPIVEVPDLRGQDYLAAKAKLEKLGLEVKYGFDIPGGDNSVLNQSPGPGTNVRKGDTVTLYTF